MRVNLLVEFVEKTINYIISSSDWTELNLSLQMYSENILQIIH